MARFPAARSIALPLLLWLGVIVAVVGTRLVLEAAAVGPRPTDLALTALAAGLLVLAFLRWPKAALLVFALHMLFGDTFANRLGYGLAQVDELFVPAALLITAWRVRPWHGRIEPVRELAVVAVVALAVVSSLANGVPAGLWLPGLVLLVKVIGFLYVAAWLDWQREDIRTLGAVVLGVGIAVIAPGYIEALDPFAFRRAIGVSNVGLPRGVLPSVKSFFYHPVLYGWFAAFLALYCFAFYAHFRRWRWLIAGIFFSAGVMLAARRRAIAGLVVALIAGLASQVRRNTARALARSWAPVGAAMLVLMVAFSSGIGDLIEQTQKEYAPPVSGPIDPNAQPEDVALGTARARLYDGSVKVAADHFPLGAGLGRYGSWMSRVEYSPLYYELGFDEVWGLKPEFPNFVTDTFWPQILGEIGVFGVFAYLVFVAAVGIGLWRAARRFRDPLLAAFCLGTLMIFGHALVETLASSMFHSPPRVYLLFGAVGMALSLARRPPPDVAPAEPAATGPQDLASEAIVVSTPVEAPPTADGTRR